MLVQTATYPIMRVCTGGTVPPHVRAVVFLAGLRCIIVFLDTRMAHCRAWHT